MKHGILFFVGMMMTALGFTLGLAGMTSVGGERGRVFEKAVSIRGGVEMDADKDGNIYINSDGNNSIQCFSPEGVFLYGIYVSPEYYWWGLDKKGMLHTMDGIHHNTYEEGTLIIREKLQDSSHEKELVKQYRTNHSLHTSCNGKNYHYLSGKVEVTDIDGNTYDIHLEVPVRQLSSSFFHAMVMAGMLLCVWSVRKLAGEDWNL